MTVSANSRRREYQGNGVTRVFNGPMAYVRAHVFAFIEKGDNLIPVASSGFDVEKLGSPAGTRVTMHTPPASGEVLVLLRTVAYTQETDITNQGAFHAETIEKGFDMLGMQIQQLDDLTLQRDYQNSNGAYNAKGVPITNVHATQGSDAISLDQVLEMFGPNDSSLFQQQGVGAIIRSFLSKARESVSVLDFGAKGDVTTDDTAAFTAALAAANEVRVPPGIYNVSGIVVPANKRLVGSGSSASVLRPLGAATYVIRLMDAAEIIGIGVNGNLVAAHGVEFGGSYCKAIETHAQYCTAGFYNINYDVWEMLGTSTDNCTYSFYNANRGINVVIDRHSSRGADAYGLYWTYSDQQPQGMRIKNGLFIGNQYGVYFEKDSFNVEINAIIDLCSNEGIHLPEVADDTSTDYIIDCPFISAANYGIYVGPGHNHVVIQNCNIANAYDGIHFSATSTKRTRGVTIRDVQIGNCSNNAISVDSPNNCLIQGCSFSAAGGSTDIGVGGTYSLGPNPRVIIENCLFYKSNAVSTFNTRVRDSVGMVTRNYGVAAMPASSTSTTVNHGLARTPNWVNVTIHGNLGVFWVSNFTSTQFTVNIGTTAGGDVAFSWEACAD